MQPTENDRGKDLYPPRVKEELEANFLRIQNPPAAMRYWEQVLTENDRQRLGGDLNAAYANGGTIGMCMLLRGIPQPHAIVEIAKALGFLHESTKTWLLREMGVQFDSIEDAVAATIGEGGLLLSEQNRQAYWRGEPIQIDWYKHPALWTFLWTLAERAKSGAGVDYMDFGEQMQPDYPSKMKSKLSADRAFPTDLAVLIEPRGRGKQQLMLPSERIRLFRTRTVEIAEQVLG